jgi:hypothetical protein
MSWVITGSQKVNWDPSLISTALWLDASDSSTITATSGSVDEWRDKSGNARHVSASSTARPVNTSTLNSKTVLTFDGSNDRMTRSGGIVTGSAARTVCIVAKPLDSDTAFDFGTESASARYSISLNTGFLGISTSNIAWSSINGNTSGIYVFSQSGINVSTVTAFWNGTSYASSSSSGPTITINTGTTITTVGSDVSQSSFFQGDIAEIVVLGQASAAPDRQRIEGYLAHKWGLTANLPSDHPYKVNVPVP